MAFYAIDDDNLIHAAGADANKTYLCPDCFAPVKQRKGERGFHFYHVRMQSVCKLNKKSDDHLLAQMRLKALFPQGEIELEKPFIDIARIADAYWAREKVAFEIQCSPLQLAQAIQRTKDYASLGVQAVWLLDDSRYNKRILRPAEAYLREEGALYLTITPYKFRIYDQFELFSEGKRIRKSRPMHIDLRKIYSRKPIQTPHLPTQITSLRCKKYFYGSRLSWSYLNFQNSLLYWKEREQELVQKKTFHFYGKRAIKKVFRFFNNLCRLS